MIIYLHNPSGLTLKVQKSFVTDGISGYTTWEQTIKDKRFCRNTVVIMTTDIGVL